MAKLVQQHPLYGCGLMLLSTVLFAGMHATVRIASETINPFEIVFFRNAFGVIVLAPWFMRHGLGIFRTSQPAMHGLRSVLNVTAMCLFFFALSMSPLAKIQALTFTAPIFTMILAGILLKETIRPDQWFCVFIGFIGTLIIVRPGIVSTDTGTLLTIASSAIWGLTLILIKKLSKTDSSVTITAWMVILMSLFSAIPAYLVWKTPTFIELGWLLAAGILGTGAQLLLAESLKNADASVVLPLDFAKIVWGALLAWLVFGEVVSIWVWVGAVMIFSTSTWITLRERNRQTAINKATETSTT